MRRRWGGARKGAGARRTSQRHGPPGSQGRTLLQMGAAMRTAVPDVAAPVLPATLKIKSARVPVKSASLTTAFITAVSPALLSSKDPTEPDSATHLIAPNVSPGAAGVINPVFSPASNVLA